MPKKIQNTTKANLISVALPTHGATYTVISHQFVIDYAYQALANAGFDIVDEEYRCTSDGQIAQGIYKLQFNSDPELSMMFAWTNSYNKQVKFKCVIGAYINQTGSVMISGDIGSWVRKHTGSADTETKATIDDYISNAHMYYTQLCSDKATMETVILNKRKQSQLLGVLFAEYEILTTEQASMIRDQMKKPYHVFANTESLWAFYNYVTNALQLSHPRSWMEDQRILHYFISTIGNFNQCSSSAQIVQTDDTVAEPVVDPLTVIPNQTNILDQIAEQDEFSMAQLAGVKAPEDVVQEELENEEVLHQSEEIVLTEDELAHQLYGVDNDIEVSIAAPENEAEEVPFDIDEDDDAVLDSLLTPCAAHDLETSGEIEEEKSEDIFPQDEIVQYTDPVGNVFEMPEIKVDTVDLNETTKMAVIVEEADLNNVFAEEDNFDLDFGDDTEDDDSIPDFF